MADAVTVVYTSHQPTVTPDVWEVRVQIELELTPPLFDIAEPTAGNA